jgi:hypothetical protein
MANQANQSLAARQTPLVRGLVRTLVRAGVQAAAVLGFFVSALAVAQTCSVQSPAQRLPLVELYTSQGCSSCPPADVWLGTLSNRDDIVPLSMHVAYWDYIGWKDPFAKAEFSQRQRWMADINKSSSVYTPGVFVGGAEFRDWSSGFMQQRLFTRTHSHAAGANIRIEKSTGPLAGWHVAAAMVGDHPSDAKRLFIASTRSGLVSKVKAGENNGRTLTNHHVVDFWSGPLATKATNQFDWQGTLPTGTDELVAFVQDMKSGEVLQATRLNLKRAECRS